MRTIDSLESALRERFPMPADVRRHAQAANEDLYFGPHGRDYWREETQDETAPDYCYRESTGIFADWLDSLDLPVYWLIDAEILCDSEPHGEDYWENRETLEVSYDEPDDTEGWAMHYAEPEAYYELNRYDVAKAFGYPELHRHP